MIGGLKGGSGSEKPNDPDGSPLLGIVATPSRVEAHLIKRTPFGRLTPAGRRILEDVDGPPRFLPLDIETQIAESRMAESQIAETSPLEAEVQPGTMALGGDLDAKGAEHKDEQQAGEAWIQSIANAVAKLTFGVRGPGLRVGLAMDARLSSDRRSVVAARGGARIGDIPSALDAALRGRNCTLSGPIVRVLEIGEAWGLGEIHSAIGLAGSCPEALVLTWDQEVSWATVSHGRVRSNEIEEPGTVLDLGFAGLDGTLHKTSSAGKLLAAARRNDGQASEVLVNAARSLGRAAGQRLLARTGAGESPQPSARAEAQPCLRIVLAGTIGRAASDHRLTNLILQPFEQALVEYLSGGEVREQALRGGLLHPTEETTEDPSANRSTNPFASNRRGKDAVSAGYVSPEGLALHPGTLFVCREDASPCVGAASLALPDSMLAALRGRASR